MDRLTCTACDDATCETAHRVGRHPGSLRAARRGLLIEPVRKQTPLGLPVSDPYDAVCSQYAPDPTRRVITAFLDAYNAGAPDVTDRFIAPAGQFQWYGAPGRQFPDDPVSTDRATLPAYFAAQHAKGDRLELKSFSSSGTTHQIDGGVSNFGYTLIHTTAGGAPHDAPGKGALACASGKIAVWLISSW